MKRSTSAPRCLQAQHSTVWHSIALAVSSGQSLHSSSVSDRGCAVQTTEIMAALSSLAIATNYEIGQQLIEEGNFSEYADYFAAVLEVLPH